jgi:hypothetical protein
MMRASFEAISRTIAQCDIPRSQRSKKIGGFGLPLLAAIFFPEFEVVARRFLSLSRWQHQPAES